MLSRLPVLLNPMEVNARFQACSSIRVGLIDC
jgi:hypothetical protein